MYFFGRSFFNSSLAQNIFQIVFTLFIISEIIIMIYTSKNNKKDSTKKDKGSFFVMIFGIWILIGLDASLRRVSNLNLPDIFFWIGSCLMIIGIILRCYSVWTLRNFFTLSVKTRSDQKIIQSGPYKYLRHPAYSGSIITFLGFSLAFRNIFGIISSIIILFLIYGYRIKVEEKVLEKIFGDKYFEYKNKTWRVIPWVI